MRIMHHFFWQNDLKKNEGSLYTFLKEYFFVAVKTPQQKASNNGLNGALKVETPYAFYVLINKEKSKWLLHVMNHGVY